MTENKHRKRQVRSWITTAAISCLCLFAAHQVARAQVGSVTLPSKEVTVKTALDEIARQSSYRTALNWDNLDADRKITVNDRTIQIRSLLTKALAGTGLTWMVSGNTITIGVASIPDTGKDARSTMTGIGLNPAQMTAVADPASQNQRPFAEISNTSGGSWIDKSGEPVSLAVINYRVNSATVERGYMNNARTLDLINQTFTNKDKIADTDYIVVAAGSSPDGNTAANEKLAERRALAMKSYLVGKYPFLSRDMIYTFSAGEDWSGLRQMVEEDTATPNRDEVLKVLDSDKNSDDKRTDLRAIGSGAAFSYIAGNMLPKLRGAAACTIHYKSDNAPAVIVQERHTTDTVYIEKLIDREVVKTIEPEKVRKPLFAIKTNLLFDLASAINVEVEVPIGKRWSVAGEWIFPWWLYEKKQYAMQVGAGTLELRYWFGDRTVRPQLTGWFMGLYGGGGYYDMEWKDKGWQGEFWHAGLSAGYAHTIGKNGNWRMEYSLGLGYLDTEYDKYVPEKDNGGEWHLIREKSDDYKWIGPTRAKVSLVWMLNHGYKKKGGSK